MSRTDPQLKIRFSPELKLTIENAAKLNGRSMNAEIVARLEQSLAMDDKAQAAMNDQDPLKGVIALCENIMQGTNAIVALTIKAGIKSGEIKIIDDDQPK